MARILPIELTRIATPGYQRSVDPRRVNKIIKEFNRNQINPPTLSERDGHLWVVDGQHTIAALLAQGQLTWECVIVSGLTYEDEARLYADRNSPRTRRALTASDQLKAMLEADDDTARQFHEIAKDLDLYFPFEGGDTSGNDVRLLLAISECFDVVRRHGPQMLSLVLRVASRAWPTQKGRFNKLIIQGLSHFLDTNKGQYDEKRLINRLSTTTPNILISEATSLQQLQGFKRP